jgi:hypothetical protein
MSETLICKAFEAIFFQATLDTAITQKLYLL